MRPPICAVCGDEAGDMTLVSFADHRPLPHGVVGHPPGLEWFCARHVRAARRRVDLPLDDALRRIRRLRRFGLA